MDFNTLSDKLLRKLHNGVREALEEDDRLPKGKKVYGVREFLDWRQCVDELEAAMAQKGVQFSPILW